MLPAQFNGSALANRVTPANRLVDRFFNDELFAPMNAAWSGMPLAMWQDEDHVYVEADAPGLTDKDVDVSVQDGIVLITGERKWAQKADGYDSRSYGRFDQRIRLPSAVDADKVEA